MQRYALALPILVLAACSSDEGTTRTFSTSRDAAPETIASSRLPLSAPPELALRPTRPDAFAPRQANPQPENAPASASAGQAALLQAAGPVASSDVRRLIDQNSGLAYPPRDFVQRLMTWSPPPGYAPVITQGSQGGWFSRMF